MKFFIATFPSHNVLPTPGTPKKQQSSPPFALPIMLSKPDEPQVIFPFSSPSVLIFAIVSSALFKDIPKSLSMLIETASSILFESKSKLPFIISC